MTKLKAEVNARQYVISFSVDGMFRLLNKERERLGSETMLSEKIDDYMGVYDCDYNGHFGANVFYTVEAEYDCPELHANIIKLVEAAIA